MRRLLLCVLLAIGTVTPFAEDLPPCNKAHAGSFWPEEANRDPALALQFAREGELQICSKPGWHYRWTHPTVTLDQLRRGKQKGEADRKKLSDPAPPQPENSPNAR